MRDHLPVFALLLAALGGCPAPSSKPADTSDTGQSAPEVTAAVGDSATKPEIAPPSDAASAASQQGTAGKPSAARDCQGCRWEGEVRPPTARATGAGERGAHGKPAGCYRNPTEIKAGQDRSCPVGCCPNHP